MNEEKEPRAGLTGGDAGQETDARQQTEAAGERPESPAPESEKKENPERTETEKAEAQAPGERTEKAGDAAEGEPGEDRPGKEKKERGAFFKSSRFRHGSVSTAFTAVFLAVIVLVNVLVGILGERFPSVNLDLTQGKSNSLTEEGAKAVDSVKIPTEIYVLATKQQVESDSLYSSQGIRYSQVGSLLAKIAERNPKIKVEYVDLDKNPTFAADYKNDSLAVGDVLVKTDKRYRVLAYTDLFNVQYSQDYSSSQVYSNVEGALVSALGAATSDKLPVVAFDTGHEEQQDMSAYQELLKNNSFETKEFNLLTDAIPENTQMIVLAQPNRDYTDEEIKKLSDFLGSKALAGDRSLMVTFYPGEAETPKLATFLEEWGIQVPRSVVVESDQSKFIANNPSYILSDIQSDLPLRATGDGSPVDYGYFITPQSNPIKILFDAKGNKSTHSLAKSSDSCYVVTSETKSAENLPKAASNTAVLSQDTMKNGDESYRANVIAVGSSMAFSDGIVNSGTFGNGKYMVDLTKYATGTADSSSQANLSAKPLNSTDITMTAEVSTFLGLGVFILLIPLAIAAAGIVVFNKRRHL